MTSGRRPTSGARVNAAFAVTPFMRLARTHAGSTAGDAMVAASLAGTIFFGAATSEARGQTFLYLVLTMAPFAVVAPLIGPALDRARSGRRWIVIGTAVARALLCFALIGRSDSLLLYPVAFALLVIQKGYGIARSSLVPGVVASDEELVEANSKLQLLSGIMSFVGAAPAALLFGLFDSPSPALALAVLTFAATAGMATRIPKVAVAPTAPSAQEKAELRSIGVLLAAGGMGLLRGIVGYLTVYFAFHFREEDQLVAFGFVAAVSVGGTLLGSVVAPRLRQLWAEERMLISVLVLTVGTGVLALAIGGVVGAAALGFVVGVSNTAGKLAFDSIVQRDAPDANRGRLFAKFETRFQLIWVVGAMIGLIPLGEIRLSFTAVALVAGFATFSYVVGLNAWRHRSGHEDATFGPQAVLIDQAMAQGKDRVRTSSRRLARRVIPRGRRADGRLPAPDPDATMVAGPGIGAALSGDDIAPVPVPVPAAPPTIEAPVPPPPPGPEGGAPAPPPPSGPEKGAPVPPPPSGPEGGAPAPPPPSSGPPPPRDPTRFDPAPAPPAPDAAPDPDAPTAPWSDDASHHPA